MTNLPFETYNIDSDELQALEDTFNVLRQKYGITVPDEADIHAGQFDCFNLYKDVSVIGLVGVNGCELVVVKIHYISRTIRGATIEDYYRHQLWAFVKLKKDFGRILIRHETLADKVIELIHHIDLDFVDDKAFSGKFYVVTNNKEKASLTMNYNFRNVIMNMHQDWMIEIVGNNLLIFNNRSVEPTEAVDLVEFAGKIARLR